MNALSVEDLTARLRAAFPDAEIEVFDDGHLHVGHAGAKSGGHFRVRVVAPAFAGLTTLARHRLVYHALGDWLPGRIHALAIEAQTPAGS